MCDSTLATDDMTSSDLSTRKPHRQPGRCADDGFGPRDILRRTGKAHRWIGFQDARDGGLRFKPGQMQPETEVGAIAKREILRRLAGDVETIGIRKPRRIAVAACDQHLDETSAWNRETSDFDVFGGGAHGRPVHPAVVTQDLLDRLVDQILLTGELCYLVP